LLKQTNAVANEFLKPITFILASPLQFDLHLVDEHYQHTPDSESLIIQCLQIGRFS